MTKKEAIDKIKKCLALSASSNEHEAELALRQAKALMEKFGIDDADILAAEASAEHAKSGAMRPPAWECELATTIGISFGCRIIHSRFLGQSAWKFIGCGIAPEIARYAFEVLFRQCKRQRSEHIKKHLKRCKTSTKTRRADLFCEGWVHSVAGKIHAFANTDKQKSAIDAYITKNLPTLRSLEARDRNEDRTLRGHEVNDYLKGKSQGKDADLNHGVGQHAAQAALKGN